MQRSSIADQTNVGRSLLLWFQWVFPNEPFPHEFLSNKTTFSNNKSWSRSFSADSFFNRKWIKILKSSDRFPVKRVVVNSFFVQIICTIHMFWSAVEVFSTQKKIHSRRQLHQSKKLFHSLFVSCWTWNSREFFSGIHVEWMLLITSLISSFFSC